MAIPAGATALAAALFEPFAAGALRLRNRIAMAPMTREFAVHGVPSANAAAYYARRALGGAGLIITEGAAIPHPVAHHSKRVPHLYGEAALMRWAEVTAAVHAAGSRIFAQLWHCGLGRLEEQTDNPREPSIAPSAVGKRPVRAMQERDIAEVIAAFAAAARNAQAAGFDGVELHGAHGYLLDQFFWTRTNRRGDAYNGGWGQRTRFAAEVLTAIRAATGPDFPIMFRFSQWKGGHYEARPAATPQELEAWLCPLADAGVDLFDASTRRFWLAEFENSPLNLAGWAKKLTGRPSMTVGSVGLERPLDANKVDEMNAAPVSLANLTALEEMLGRGDFDLVALGRMLLANPEWPRLVRDGRLGALHPYDPQAAQLRLECAAVPNQEETPA